VQCPQCRKEELAPGAPCPACGFSADAALLERLSNLHFLLSELQGWLGVQEKVRQELKRKYERELREVEVALGLRAPPLTTAAARELRIELAQANGFLYALPVWEKRGWITPATRRELEQQMQLRVKELHTRLVDAPHTRLNITHLSLAKARFVLHKLEESHESGQLTGEAAYAAASAELATIIERREIQAGVRPQPEPTLASTPPARPEPAPAPPPRPPRPPLTWDRVWETLLSERTLKAILFVGAALLFAAAVSLVVWNWEAFPPWLQVTFLTLFTAIFYTLGWYVRGPMKLRGSGMALSAVASLLIPLDFYAFYLSGGFPEERWPEVWLLASALCLVAYSLTLYLLQAEFFGYLVGLAAGSLLAAALRVTHVDPDVWQAALGGLALALALAAGRLQRHEGRWRVLAAPLWRVALLGTTTIMLLALGWEFTGRAGSTLFSASLAVDWALGGVVLILAARRYRSRSLALGAALAFPIAAWLGQRVAFDVWQVSAVWHAWGWALLAPFYLEAGRELLSPEPDPLHRAWGRMAMSAGSLLILLASVWSAFDVTAAAVFHPLLAVTLLRAAYRWRRPRLLFLTSLLLLSGSAAWVASRATTLAQIGLVWALLAILHLIAALRLRRTTPRYDRPLVAAGWAIAGLALLPPLFTSDRPTLTYVLGNWMAVSGWLALLAHHEELPGLRILLDTTFLRATTFHWAAALPLPVWMWLVWTNRRPEELEMATVFLPVAWALLALGARLRRARPAYGRPWHTVAHACLLAGIATTLVFYDQAWAAVALLLAATFYFTAAALFRRCWWLAAGALVLPFGWALGLNVMGLERDPLGVALALLVAGYTGVAAFLERWRRASRAFLFPLYVATPLVALGIFVWNLPPLLASGRSDATLLWAAGAQLILGTSFGVLAWLFKERTWGHVAAWLGVLAGGLVAVAYSQGRGSSAAKAALLAILYVLAERGLDRLRRNDRLSQPTRRFFRRAWSLYARPLLVAGWSVSLGAILLALFRNLILLGGGRGRETWSAIGLLMVSGLYLLAARLFSRPIFLWLGAALLLAPWTLLNHLGWFLLPPPTIPGLAIGWAALALIELLVAIAISSRLRPGRWSQPFAAVAHLLLPFGLLWTMADVDTAWATFGLGVLFYLLAVWADHRFRRTPDGSAPGRFLYPAATLMPVWALYLLARFAPTAPQTTYGLTLLAFTLPSLLLGRRFAGRERTYSLPLYLVAYTTALAGTALVAHDRPVLIGALLFDTLVAGLSTWLFREPLWLYPASATLPAALVLALAEWNVPDTRFGWALIGLGGLYVLASYLLRPRRPAYGTPLAVAAFALIALGLPPSSRDHTGALWGYGAAAALYALAAAWLRQPLLVSAATGLATVPAWVLILELNVPAGDRGLALWPGILLALGIAHLLDRRVGVVPAGEGEPAHFDPFPWSRPLRWPEAAVERVTRWWALPLYVAAYAGGAVGAALSLGDPARLTPALALAALAYAHATARFRLRGWLLASVVAAQLAALAAIRWIGWWDRAAVAALAFAPVAWLTALAGLAVQHAQEEGAPFHGGLDELWRGWSRPLYLVLAADLLMGQLASLSASGEGALVSLSHALLLGVLVTAWGSRWLAYLPPVLGLTSLVEYLVWQEAPSAAWPRALALLALGYGLTGYLLRLLQKRDVPLPRGAVVWDLPLRLGGWNLSIAGLLALGWVQGIDILRPLARAALHLPVLTPASVEQVQLFITVVALLGLFYLAAALVERWRWLGYGSVTLLLVAWGAEWLLVWGQREVQGYAIPAGVYLLGVGYLEWNEGSRTLARWIDRAAVVLLLGSSFWQSLGDYGGRYALLMGLEATLIGWWGSARRVRRFLYAGVAGMMLDIGGQLIEPLLSANRWIVFGVAGALFITLAILIERRLERVKQLSHEVRQRLEAWE
jgi:hypothetical protein